MEETVLNKRRCIAMLLGVLCLFGACAGGALRQGTWQDGVFTNKWAGIRFAAGEGERALDAAEMREWTGGAAGAAYNDPAAKPDWGETALFYDCILTELAVYWLGASLTCLMATLFGVYSFMKNVVGLYLNAADLWPQAAKAGLFSAGLAAVLVVLAWVLTEAVWKRSISESIRFAE